MQSSHGGGDERAACTGGGTSGSPSPGTRVSRCACAIAQRDLATTGHSFRRLFFLFVCFFFFFFFVGFFFLFLAILFFRFLQRRTHKRREALLQSYNILRTSVSLFSQELLNNALETRLCPPSRLCYNVEKLQSILQILLFLFFFLFFFFNVIFHRTGSKSCTCKHTANSPARTR